LCLSKGTLFQFLILIPCHSCTLHSPSASQPLPKEPLAGFSLCSAWRKPSIIAAGLPSAVIVEWRRDRLPAMEQTGSDCPDLRVSSFLCRDAEDSPCRCCTSCHCLVYLARDQGKHELMARRRTTWLGLAIISQATCLRYSTALVQVHNRDHGYSLSEHQFSKTALRLSRSDRYSGGRHTLLSISRCGTGIIVR